MKVVEVVNHFGRLELLSHERFDFDKLFDILSRDPAPRYSDVMLGSDARRKEKRDFIDIVKRRFEGFPLSALDPGQYNVTQNYGLKDTAIGPAELVDIGSGSFVPFGSRSSPAYLYLARKDGCYFGQLYLSNVPEQCEDDLVGLLGARESPAMVPFSRVTTFGHTTAVSAQVDRICLLRELYAKAQGCIDSAPRTINLSRDDLNVLRRDFKHESPVIRDLSKERYDRELARLINR